MLLRELRYCKMDTALCPAVEVNIVPSGIALASCFLRCITPPLIKAVPVSKCF
jgi:hypothetical protein